MLKAIKEQLIGEYLIKLPVGREAKVSWSLSTIWANAARPFLKEALNTQPHTCLTRRPYSNPRHKHTHTHANTQIYCTHTPPRRVPQQQLRAELNRSQREVRRNEENNQITDLGEVSVWDSFLWGERTPIVTQHKSVILHCMSSSASLHVKLD